MPTVQSMIHKLRKTVSSTYKKRKENEEKNHQEKIRSVKAAMNSQVNEYMKQLKARAELEELHNTRRKLASVKIPTHSVRGGRKTRKARSDKY